MFPEDNPEPRIKYTDGVAKQEDILALDLMNSIVIEAERSIKILQDKNAIGSSREKSIVITKLEEAVLWAKRDIELNHKL